MSSLKDKTYWRSLSELVESADDGTTPEAERFLDQRIPEHRELFGDPLSRRRFMQVMGASIAFAGAGGLSGCHRYERDHIVPLDQRPDDYVPGVPATYATAMDIGGAAYGLIATSYDGRPIKVDGNQEHPHTGRGSNSLVQASILNLYDPDRSRRVERRQRGQAMAASWDDFDETVRQWVDTWGDSAGRGLRVLSEATSSPTVAALRRLFLARFPSARWHEWEPLSNDNEREGLRMAFGQPLRAHLQLSRAKVIAAFDADLFGPDRPDNTRLAREYGLSRDPDSGTGMSRLYAVESAFSITGASADHRLPLRSELIKPFLMALDARLGGAGGPKVASQALDDPKVAKFLSVLAKDLSQHKGQAVVTVGFRQPPEVHALAARINATLAAEQGALVYTADPDPERPSHAADIAALVGDMKKGAVETLFILGGNPVYDAPADLDFAGALGGVKNSVHLAAYSDETSARCNWHLPRAHYLESWGDARTWDGTYTLAQPIIEPIFGGRSTIEVLRLLVGQSDIKPDELVRTNGYAQVTGADPNDSKAWRKALCDGFATGTAYQPVAGRAVSQFQLSKLTPSQSGGLRLPNGQLELVFVPSSATHDGRYANNAWLQETPDFLTKCTWDNPVLVSPKTASELGLSHEEIVKIEIQGRSLEAAVYVMPGQAPFSIALPLGQGRTRAGKVGGMVDDHVDPVGFDTYRLRGSKAPFIAGGAKVTPTGKKYRLSLTVDHYKMDSIGTDAITYRVKEQLKETTLEEYQRDPNFIVEEAESKDDRLLVSPPTADEANRSLYEEHRYDDAPHKWGMTTDLSKCIGCNACMLACQSENNVPVVGKEQVWMNREMHWIRIDRFFAGDPEDPEIARQPVACQQCENAPCEQVCPVGATLHSPEGLNDMVYNRCVGTRYCLNNCPYRVRRFNFLRWDWYKDIDDPRNQIRRLLFNPEVTVRMRGVMEKCTFCVQRIQNHKIVAKNEHREIADGEIKTACQEACPTGAITFGDLNDKNSRVSALHGLPRAYSLLAYLNTRPRNAYLARIRNPHPELG